MEEKSFSSVVSATNENLLRLSSKVSAAAHTIATPYGEFSSSRSYQEAMSEISGPLFRKRMFSFSGHHATPSRIVKGSGIGKSVAFIGDDLLENIPPARSQYSLYQGFEAEFEAPKTAEPARKLKLCKELATSEINEIDERIKELQAVRRVVFDRVAGLELEERRSQRQEQLSDSAGWQEGSAVIGAAEPELAAPKKRSRQPPRGPKAPKSTLQRFYAPGDVISTFSTGQVAVGGLDFDEPYGTLTVAVGSQVHVWDLSEMQMGSLVGHQDTITCVRIDSSLVASGSLDKSVRLWNVKSDKPLLATYAGHLDGVTALHLHDDFLASGSFDRTVRLWDIDAVRCIQTLDVMDAAPAGTFPAVGAVQNYKNAALATGTGDGIVRLWDLRSGNVERKLVGHLDAITCLHFDETSLVSGSKDKSVRIWDLRTGAVCESLSFEKPVTCLDFDSSKVVVAAGEPTVKAYNRLSETQWTCGPGETDSEAADVLWLRYMDGYLVEGRQDGMVGVWAV